MQISRVEGLVGDDYKRGYFGDDAWKMNTQFTWSASFGRLVPECALHASLLARIARAWSTSTALTTINPVGLPRNSALGRGSAFGRACTLTLLSHLDLHPAAGITSAPTRHTARWLKVGDGEGAKHPGSFFDEVAGRSRTLYFDIRGVASQVALNRILFARASCQSK